MTTKTEAAGKVVAYILAFAIYITIATLVINNTVLVLNALSHHGTIEFVPVAWMIFGTTALAGVNSWGNKK